jgi:hypothetical protein
LAYTEVIITIITAVIMEVIMEVETPVIINNRNSINHYNNNTEQIHNLCRITGREVAYGTGSANRPGGGASASTRAI